MILRFRWATWEYLQEGETIVFSLPVSPLLSCGSLPELSVVGVITGCLPDCLPAFDLSTTRANQPNKTRESAPGFRFLLTFYRIFFRFIGCCPNDWFLISSTHSVAIFKPMYSSIYRDTFPRQWINGRKSQWWAVSMWSVVVNQKRGY